MLTLILGKSLAHLGYLLIAQAPRQLDRRGRDGAHDLGNGLGAECQAQEQQPEEGGQPVRHR